MDHPLHYPPTTLLAPSSPTSRATKVIQQRQYREKESELFNILRVVIHGLTEEQLQTRQEILRKAIDLLSVALETKRLENTAAVHLVETCPSLGDHNDVTSTQLGSSGQSSRCPQCLLSPVEFDEQTAHYASPTHVQQYHSMPDIGSTLSPTTDSSREYENWSHHF